MLKASRSRWNGITEACDILAFYRRPFRKDFPTGFVEATIAFPQETSSETETGGRVLSAQTRRQRVKRSAVDSALIAENIVE